MNTEFERLYKEHWNKTWMLACKPSHCPTWEALVDWAKANREEAIDCIIEMLKEEPNDIVGLCDVLFPDSVTYEDFVPLDIVCNTWLVILTAYKNGQVLETTNPYEFPDHYKEYKKYMKYMEKNYIPWNPFHEKDPNITLEDFMSGKRNDRKLLKERKSK